MDNLASRSSLHLDGTIVESEDENEEANRREIFRLAHKEKGFVGVVQEAASLGRLTRLQEHVVEASGRKSNQPKRGRRASIVATNLLDIQWNTTHHGAMCNELVTMGTMFRGNEVITESVHPSAANNAGGLSDIDSGWDTCTYSTDSDDYDEFGGESDDDGEGKQIEHVVKRVKEEARAKNKLSGSNR